MSGISVVSQPLPEAERNRSVYDGIILVWPALEAVTELAARLGRHVRDHFGDAPQTAHQRDDETALTEALNAAQQAVDSDDGCQRQIKCVFEAAGMQLDGNCSDRLKLRAQMPHSRAGQRGVAPLMAHRDTWGTNIMAQTNWWAPIYPAPPERTIALYPGWFERSIANDSADWDFAEMRRRYKQEGSRMTYPLLPTALELPVSQDALPVGLQPGSLLAFSGAHLHASVPNATDCMRFSFEIRSVNAADALAGRGAPNVDGRAPRIPWQLFRGLADGHKLGEMA